MATFRSPGMRGPGTASSPRRRFVGTNLAYATGRLCTRRPAPRLRRAGGPAPSPAAPGTCSPQAAGVARSRGRRVFSFSPGAQPVIALATQGSSGSGVGTHVSAARSRVGRVAALGLGHLSRMPLNGGNRRNARREPSLLPPPRRDVLGRGCRDGAMTCWSYGECVERSTRDGRVARSATRLSGATELAGHDFDARELEVSLPGELLT